jgi:hypothetical protein
VSCIGEDQFSCGLIVSEENRAGVLTVRDTAVERGVQLTHKFRLIPSIYVLADQAAKKCGYGTRGLPVA